ncbi:hypothetical protein [Sphingobacterium sp.]|uniref:hypothetical protein n=1 Tax=Sphingobacterium sp. TaxID=341027 RepID=UPI0028AC626B|nr:hypothetical protein [Sphingobacterium sp.]
MIIDRLKALGYSMNEIIDILIMTESKKSNLLKLIELLELKEELKNKEDGK